MTRLHTGIVPLATLRALGAIAALSIIAVSLDLVLGLSDEVDLDAVRSSLLGAVGDTLQPATASLWLRNDSRTIGG